MTKYPKAFLEICQSITDKRPKTVIDHILKHGHITTDELKTTYGYNYPPRAARDVRERGLPLETFRVVGPDGRKIAAYCFADPSKVKFRRFDGRTGLSKKIKDNLIEKYGCRCFIYLEEVDDPELQIDHRVPYEIAGDTTELNPDDFMLLCGSANRAKSWSCKHCENWQSKKAKELCLSCYWAYLENYTHIAMRQVRRLDLMWQGDEIEKYERLKSDTQEVGMSIPNFVKDITTQIINNR